VKENQLNSGIADRLGNALGALEKSPSMEATAMEASKPSGTEVPLKGTAVGLMNHEAADSVVKIVDSMPCAFRLRLRSAR